jgi:hypothetical protein
MAPGFARSHGLPLAVAGSILMFLGWILAIVPTFRDLGSVWPIVLLALIAFAVVLIPPGVDLFARPATPGHKRGPIPVLISTLPAAGLFLITVFELPLAAGVRAAAIVLELVGMAVYVWAWWSYRHVTSPA